MFRTTEITLSVTTNPASPAETLKAVELDTAPNPTHAVVWLHGLGADGYDFVPIVPELFKTEPGESPRQFPPLRFIFPHAPVQAVSINAGMHMPAWYDIRHTDLGRQEDEAGLRQSEQRVSAWLGHLEQNVGIQSSHIVLAGFSQGAAMTLQTGLRYPHRLAGLIALSGYLPLVSTLANERSDPNRNTPIFAAHGLDDAIVPVSRGKASAQTLADLSYRVTWHTYPMGHSVCQEEISDIADALEDFLV